MAGGRQDSQARALQKGRIKSQNPRRPPSQWAIKKAAPSKTVRFHLLALKKADGGGDGDGTQAEETFHGLKRNGGAA